MANLKRLVTACVSAIAISCSVALAPAQAEPTTASSSQAVTSEPTSQTAAITSTDPSIVITSVGDSLLEPDEDLTVEATVTNPGTEPFTVTEESLWGQRQSALTRTRLLNFMRGNAVALDQLASDPTERVVAAGESITFSFTVDRDSLRWGTSEAVWGPHGVEMSVTLSDGSRLSDRSVVVATPSYTLTPMPTGVVVPLNVSATEMSSSSTLQDTIATNLAAGTETTPEPSEEPTDEPTEDATTDSADSASPTQSVDATQSASPSAESSESADPESPSGSNESRLSTTLSALSINGVTVALQPESIAQASSTGDSSADDGSTGDSSSSLSTAALREFTSTSGSQLILMPSQDADATALIQANRGNTLISMYSSASGTVAPTGITALSNIAVSTPSADQDTLATLVTAGVGGVVVAGDEVTPTGYRYYTPSARTDISLADSGVSAEEGSARSIAALATDATISAALAGVLVEEDHSTATSDDPINLTALDSQQLVVALSAVTYRERPNDSRAVLLAVDRSGVLHYGNTDPAEAEGDDALAAENLSATISALMSAPWVQPTTVSDMLSLTASTSPRESLPASTDATGTVTATEISASESAFTRISSVANLAAESSLITTPSSLVVQQLTATAWRSNESGRAEKLSELLDVASSLSTAINVEQSSAINIISQATELPIHVTNDLPVDVGVVVSLESKDARISPGKAVAVTIPANSTTKVMIPVEATGSGNASVTVNVLSPSGEVVGVSQAFDIRVRADWENVGTLIVAILLALVLVLGVVRSLRRGPRSEADLPSADDVAYKDSDAADDRGATSSL